MGGGGSSTRRPVRTPAGEVGELWTRSHQNMAGYWDNPSATAEAITDDGWFRTGDAGYIDADGFLYLHDRVKDMIVSGGENVYPAEVENVLAKHPGVADVAVIGVPDDKGRGGEGDRGAQRARRDRGRADHVRPGEPGRLQAAEVGRLRRGAAAQPSGKLLSGSCASPTGWEWRAASADCGPSPPAGADRGEEQQGLVEHRVVAGLGSRSPARPDRAGRTSTPMSSVTRPFSLRSSAKRHWTRGGGQQARPIWPPNCSNTRRSNFHCQPPSTSTTVGRRGPSRSRGSSAGRGPCGTGSCRPPTRMGPSEGLAQPERRDARGPPG